MHCTVPFAAPFTGSFGDQAGDVEFEQMYALSLQTERWCTVEQAGGLDHAHPHGHEPARRLGHAMLLHGNDLYLFAGSTSCCAVGRDQDYFNDLFVAHLEPPSLKSFLCAYIHANSIPYKIRSVT